MAEISIDTETEGPDKWTYDICVTESKRTHRYTVTLSWSDYDLWSHGRVRPEKVVRAAFEFLLQKKSTSNITTKFDCSLIRRYFPEVDQELSKMV